jgi:hypothetical protein
MLGKWPNPGKLSEMSAWARGLWIRRVLVRAEEGQLGSLEALARSRVFLLNYHVFTSTGAELRSR